MAKPNGWCNEGVVPAQRAPLCRGVLQEHGSLGLLLSSQHRGARSPEWGKCHAFLPPAKVMEK